MLFKRATSYRLTIRGYAQKFHLILLEEIRNFSATDKAVVLIKEATAAFEALKNIPDITEEAKGVILNDCFNSSPLLVQKILISNF